MKFFVAPAWVLLSAVAFSPAALSAECVTVDSTLKQIAGQPESRAILSALLGDAQLASSLQFIPDLTLRQVNEQHGASFPVEKLHEAEAKFASLCVGTAEKSQCPPFTATFGELLENPKSKEILTRYIPDLVNSEHLQNAQGMPLTQVSLMIKPWAPSILTDEMLKQIEADITACN